MMEKGNNKDIDGGQQQKGQKDKKTKRKSITTMVESENCLVAIKYSYDNNFKDELNGRKLLQK